MNRLQSKTTGEAFLQALLSRDFNKMETYLDPKVRFRTLLPSGYYDSSGPAGVIADLSDWFGSASNFEVLDSQVEKVNDRLRLAYKFRLRPHPEHPRSGWQIIEQQIFCNGGTEKLTGIDLLCSGFLAESRELGDDSL